jgi:hypothetical protein
MFKNIYNITNSGQTCPKTKNIKLKQVEKFMTMYMKELYVNIPIEDSN